MQSFLLTELDFSFPNGNHAGHGRITFDVKLIVGQQHGSAGSGQQSAAGTGGSPLSLDREERQSADSRDHALKLMRDVDVMNGTNRSL